MVKRAILTMVAFFIRFVLRDLEITSAALNDWLLWFYASWCVCVCCFAASVSSRGGMLIVLLVLPNC